MPIVCSYMPVSNQYSDYEAYAISPVGGFLQQHSSLGCLEWLLCGLRLAEPFGDAWKN